MKQSTFSPILKYPAGYQPRYKQQGFTILELVLVLFLIGLLASAGLLFTQNIEDQAQFEETQRRYERIQEAILGQDSLRQRNVLSGFVNDNGRLPICLAELLELGPEISANLHQSPCTDEAAYNLTRWAIDDNSQISGGWQGPYIQVTPDQDGIRRYRDGYENDPNSDPFFYGWEWRYIHADGSVLDPAVEDLSTVAPEEIVALRLQSAGFDFQDPNDDYPQGDIDSIVLTEQVPELITETDYRVTYQNPHSIEIVFENLSDTQQPLATDQLRLDLYFSSAASGVGVVSSDEFPVRNDITLPSKSDEGTLELAVGDQLILPPGAFYETSGGSSLIEFNDFGYLEFQIYETPGSAMTVGRFEVNNSDSFTINDEPSGNVIDITSIESLNIPAGRFVRLETSFPDLAAEESSSFMGQKSLVVACGTGAGVDEGKVFEGDCTEEPDAVQATLFKTFPRTTPVTLPETMKWRWQ